MNNGKDTTFGVYIRCKDEQGVEVEDTKIITHRSYYGTHSKALTGEDNIKTKDKKYGVYIRVNKKNKNDCNAELWQKEEQLLKYCRDKGYEVSNIYADIGYSGKIEGREALKKIFKDATDGRINGIIAQSISQLFRDSYVEVERAIKFESLKNIEVVTMEEGSLNEIHRNLNEIHRNLKEKLRQANKVIKNKNEKGIRKNKIKER